MKNNCLYGLAVVCLLASQTFSASIREHLTLDNLEDDEPRSLLATVPTPVEFGRMDPHASEDEESISLEDGNSNVDVDLNDPRWNSRNPGAIKLPHQPYTPKFELEPTDPWNRGTPMEWTTNPPMMPPMMSPAMPPQSGLINKKPYNYNIPHSYKVIDEATAFLYEENGENTEFILVDRQLRWHQASLYCQNKFKGHLAIIDNSPKSEFISRSVLDQMDRNEMLWINGKFSNNEWIYYITREEIQSVDPNWLSEIINSTSSKRHCLSVSSSTFNEPAYLDANCQIERRFVCERSAGTEDLIRGHSLHETHPGWIQIFDKYYKIFADSMKFDDAATKCLDEDPTASLAVALSAAEVKQLGRYMLVTRPSIQAAWIGGAYSDDDGWTFPSEDFTIPVQDSIDENGWMYPFWATPRPTPSNKNCLALVRYPNGTIFKEAPCNATMQGYICYKKGPTSKKVELNCANKNYDLSVHAASWQNAKDACLARNQILAEPKNDEQLSCLSYIMTELPPVPVRHLWLGGKGANSQSWGYLSDNSNVFLASELWMKNLTLVPHLDHEYTCLNMDKLSLEKIIMYGTDCTYRQRFVCESDFLPQVPRLY